MAHPDVQTLLSSETPPEVRAAALAPEESGNGAIEFTDQGGHRFLATFADGPEAELARVRPAADGGSLRRVPADAQRNLQGPRPGHPDHAGRSASFISQVIVGRVRTLQRAMEQVGEGNFDVPQVPASNDEFGSLDGKVPLDGQFPEG